MSEQSPICLESGCGSVTLHARGYCGRHFQKHRRRGDFIGVKATGYRKSPALVLTDCRPSQYARERGISRQRVNQMRFPEKNRARQSVAYALKTGRMVRPDHCEGCGTPCKPQAHHRDYSKPLEVEWNCTRCHTQHHTGESYRRQDAA